MQARPKCHLLLEIPPWVSRSVPLLTVMACVKISPLRITSAHHPDYWSYKLLEAETMSYSLLGVGESQAMQTLGTGKKTEERSCVTTAIVCHLNSL